MSLVGRLEDLGLGEILQLLSLSGKTGLLSLRDGRGRHARIFLTHGSIEGVLTSDGYQHLGELILRTGAIQPHLLEELAVQAKARGELLATVLCERGAFDTDQLDSLLREAAEAAILDLFRWNEGEFSFEMTEETAELDQRELRLRVGLNAQFLALEGTRRADEENHQAFSTPPVAEEEDWAIQFDEGFAKLENPETEGEAEAAPKAAQPEGPYDAAADFSDVLATVEASEIPAAEASAPAQEPTPLAEADFYEGPIIALDSDLSVLEWVKASLEDQAGFVHIFQSLDLARDRFRHYLARGVMPLVLVSQHAPSSDAKDWRELVARLRSQAPKLPLIFLDDPEHPDQFDGKDFRGVIERPSRNVLSDPNLAASCEKRSVELQQLVARAEPDAGETTAEPRGEELERIRSFTATLCSPEARGRVLELVVAFAAESFRRVALFMVRDGELRGMAQRGLAQVHDDGSFREVRIQLSANPHLEQACREGRAGAQQVDPIIAQCLGAEPNALVYCAPIYGGEQLAAVLYADNAPERSLPDPRALEIVLHGANLALERALLELVLEQEN